MWFLQARCGLRFTIIYHYQEYLHNHTKYSFNKASINLAGGHITLLAMAFPFNLID